MQRKDLLFTLLIVLLAIACQRDDAAIAPAPDESVAERSGPVSIDEALLDQMNTALAQEDLNYRVVVAEYITNGESSEAGLTVLAKDVGNKQLSFDFVPFDSRRAGWSGPTGGGNDNITYALDQTFDAVPPFGGLSAAQANGAIQRATGTWDGLSCSDPALAQNPDFGIDVGVVAFIFGFGGSPFIFADIQHAGWRDINFAGGILGVTFTFGFVDGSGNFTDIDNNGKLDAAFREIYYDPSFSWADDGASNIDVETVALHEIGHGLSQAHFGQIAIKNDGSLKASPRAVMNALYAGPLPNLRGSDNGGHCSNWGQWPHN